MAATLSAEMVREDYLLNGEEVTITDLMTPTCDGNAGPLGHPVEYLTLEKGLEAVCKYCDRRFIHVSNPMVEKVRKEGEPFVA